MPQKDKLFWTPLPYPDGQLLLAATERGLCFVALPNQALETVLHWADKRVRAHQVTRDDTFMTPYLEQMKAYLEGTLHDFDFSLDVRGTPFQRDVWNALSAIPYGATTTYTEIATRIGRPQAVRAVGAAIGSNPLPIVVPCHRVIGKGGALTGYRGGLQMKQSLLRQEDASVLR